MTGKSKMRTAWRQKVQPDSKSENDFADYGNYKRSAARDLCDKRDHSKNGPSGNGSKCECE